MAQDNRIEVVDPEGWRKEFVMNKPMLFVGSDPGADVRLNSAQVAPRHLQIMPVAPIGFRIVNLSGLNMPIGAPGEDDVTAARAIGPRATAEVGDGEWINVMGYRLTFHGGEQRSANYQVRVETTSSELKLDQPLDGAVIINHVGSKAGVQFKVDLRGFDARFCQIEPGPVLFPGVERRVAFRLTHPRQSEPAAGAYTLTFVVSAPDDYVGESTTVKQAITVAPYYAHRLKVQVLDPAMADYAL